jgi:hypothetical protein
MQRLCNPKAEVKQGPASEIGCCCNPPKSVKDPMHNLLAHAAQVLPAETGREQSHDLQNHLKLCDVVPLFGRHS